MFGMYVCLHSHLHMCVAMYVVATMCIISWYLHIICDHVTWYSYRSACMKCYLCQPQVHCWMCVCGGRVSVWEWLCVKVLHTYVCMYISFSVAQHHATYFFHHATLHGWEKEKDFGDRHNWIEYRKVRAVYVSGSVFVYMYCTMSDCVGLCYTYLVCKQRWLFIGFKWYHVVVL